MVYSKRMRMTTKKKTFRRKSFRRKPKLYRRPQGLGTVIGYPKMLKFKHKYVDTFLVSTPASTPWNKLTRFSCNNLFDPWQDGSGHQPLFFDGLSNIYNHFTVIASKITWTLVPAGTAVQAPYKAITFINDDTSPAGTIPMEESGRGHVRLCQGGVNPDKIVMSQAWSAKKTYGGSVLGNDELQGSGTAGPTEQQYYELLLAPLDNTSEINCYLHVTIVYVAIWDELKDHFSS